MNILRRFAGLFGAIALVATGCHGTIGDPPLVVIAIDGGRVPTLLPGEQLTLHANTTGISLITYAWTVSGAAATAVGPSDGASFTLAAAATITSAVTFSVTITCTGKDADGKPVTVTASLDINSQPGFHPAPDSFAAVEDVTLIVAAPGLLGNDTDGDRSDLTIAVVKPPAHGKLTLGAHGDFTYLGDANFSGADEFVYSVKTTQGSTGQATATITVDPANDPPTALDHAMHLDEDTPLTIDAPGVLAGATDVESDPLTAQLVATTTHGMLVLSDDGSFIYTPAPNYFGPDSFTYVALDGHGGTSDVHTISLTVQPVNDAPVAVGDAYMATEDVILAVVANAGVLANDTDVDGDPITAVVVAQPLHGTLTLQANGSFTYVPSANYNGPDGFTYTAGDAVTQSSVATVTITVTGTEDLPVGANDSYSVGENGVLTLAAPGVLGNDTDADGNALTAVIVTQPTNGTLMLSADGSFTYTPNTSFVGTDTFVYEPNDGIGDGSLATVTIKVIPPDNPPVAVADPGYSTSEDTTLTVLAAAGVLANDLDADGDPLTAIVVTPPLHGSLTLNPDGSFQYVPTANYNGTDFFTYKANDGTLDSNTALVTINIGAVDDAPVAHNDAYNATQNTTLNVDPASGVLANDTDLEGDTIVAILATAPLHGGLTLNPDGSFTYTPTAGYIGPDSFTYKASDGVLDSTTVTVSIAVAP